MKPSYRFDDIELDLEAFRLTRAGDPVRLEPKVLELLGYLVQNRGRLVEKPELQRAIWSDTAVSESALTRAVAQLRKALEDDAREARYVETVPTRGYRFRPEVSVEERLHSERGNGHAPRLGPPSPLPPRSRPTLVAAGVAATAVLVALVGWRSRTAPTPEASPGREVRRTPVSTTRGFNAFPTFSPDGSAVAFSSDRSGRLEIYVRPLAAGARETPITSDGQENVQPAWSPDGRFIAYHSLRRGGLWILPALGGVPRAVAPFGSAPAWSPDGKRLAFSSLGLVAFEGIAQFGASLWMVEMDGDVPGPPRRLTETGQPAAGHGAPSFTPDGAEVVFASDGLWAVRADGSQRVRPLVEGWAPDGAVSPDGKRLYWSGWERGAWHVWAADMPTGETPVRDRVEVAITGAEAARHLRISREGRLACSLLLANSEVAVLPLASDGSPSGPATEPVASLSGKKVQLHFSRDGTLAFAVTQPGQAFEVMGLDPRTGVSRPLLPTAERGFLHGFFPAGDALLVTMGEKDDRFLARAPVNGGRIEPLMPTDRMGWARLLPSGREIVFHSLAHGVLNVRRANLDGSSLRALTDDAEGIGWPVPSPDGQSLMVEMFRGADAQLGLMPADGSAPPRALTHVAGQHWGHDWSPDGRRVLYGARRDGLWNVYWMNVETGEERRLTDHARVRDAVRTPAWAPAGDRIAYERLEVTGGVWVFDLRTPDR
jgi:Tol biopolymer transport system component/DNA-binding winged helix-turn-helix (wHTH) protein